MAFGCRIHHSCPEASKRIILLGQTIQSLNPLDNAVLPVLCNSSSASWLSQCRKVGEAKNLSKNCSEQCNPGKITNSNGTKIAGASKIAGIKAGRPTSGFGQHIGEWCEKHKSRHVAGGNGFTGSANRNNRCRQTAITINQR